MAIPNRRGPRALADILGELFTARGYGRSLARQELEDAWSAAVGEPLCRQTHLGEVRRGVLNVSVSHSALLEELSAFRKTELLAAVRQGAPGTTIHDIRFKVGLPAPAASPKPNPENPNPENPNPDAAAGAAPTRASSARRRGGGLGAPPGRRRGPARG
ncbi:MAG: DUF721 domain-containing protein [Isosphaeraceae bacterium]